MRRVLHGLAGLVLGVLCMASGPGRAEAGLGAGLHSFELSVDGLTRQYHLYMPSGGPPGADGYPVVVAFHGGGGRALAFGRRTDLPRLAASGRAVILLPQGLGAPGRRGGSWNVGQAVPTGYAARTGVDDLGFVDAMLTDVAGRVALDDARVFAVGLSMGGMMAYHAACNLEGRFAAIAAVAGGLETAACPYADDVSLLHIHGTEDENVPFDGGRGTLTAPRANWSDVARGIGLFQSANACDAAPAVTRPARDTTCRTRRCDASERVEHCLVDGGGHAWPGTAPARWQKTHDVYVSPHFDATAHIAAFFFSP